MDFDHIYAYALPGNAKSLKVMEAFATKAPVEIVPAENGLLDHGTPLIWGNKNESQDLIRSCWKTRRPFIYADMPYYTGQIVKGAEQEYFRLCANGLQLAGITPRPKTRYKQALDQPGIRLQPWRDEGEHILVIPPSPFVASLYHMEHWLISALVELKKRSRRPVVIREKPQKIREFNRLTHDLENCHAVVTFASNSAIEAVIQGVPVFTSPYSAAFPMASGPLVNIEHPALPERAGWLNHLFYGQFHLDEIRNGTAWSIIRDDLMNNRNIDLFDRFNQRGQPLSMWT